jgi:hypothetical protein
MIQSTNNLEDFRKLEGDILGGKLTKVEKMEGQEYK